MLKQSNPLGLLAFVPYLLNTPAGMLINLLKLILLGKINDVGNAKAGRQAGNSFLTCYVVV